ncbi:MAG: hypothetical protein WED15_02860 [Akkermansiaceae bacterium]
MTANPPHLKLLPWLLLLAAVPPAHAAPVTGPWSIAQGGGPVTNETTASPTVGDGTANSADTDAIYSTIPAVTLANVGDKLTLTGSATLTGIVPNGIRQFRWGLFDVNSSADINGWLGYFATQGSGTTGGELYERNNGNTSAYFSGTGVSITNGSAPGTAISFADGTYAFSLTLEKVASGLQVNSAITRTSDSQDFGSVSLLDSSVQTATFNRVGFLIGGTLDADQVQFSNINATFEPGGTPPFTPGPRVLGIDFNRNDSLGSPSQAMFRVISGSTTQSNNSASYAKTIGAYQVTITQPGGTLFEFRGANGDSTRAIPGGDTSRSFLVADFITTRKGAIDLTITGLPAGNYVFRSHHLDTQTTGQLGFAQGATTTTPNTIEARIGGVTKASVQPTALGSSGLNTTFISDAQIPTLLFPFAHDGNSPLVIQLRSTVPNATDNFLLLNGFEILQANP